MLFERRAYTLRPGCEETFWQLQRKWNTPKTYRPMLERNFGYFAITAGSAERIIHLYRWDDYEDGKRRIAAIATPERAEYFAAARDLMLAQESILLDRSPIAELNPLWSGDRDWLPGEFGIRWHRRLERVSGFGECTGFSSWRTCRLLGGIPQT